jgi:hypothetical protein
MFRVRFERLTPKRLGDTTSLLDGSKLSAFGVCHVGPKTEAVSGVCYVKNRRGALRSSAQNSFESCSTRAGIRRHAERGQAHS